MSAGTPRVAAQVREAREAARRQARRLPAALGIALGAAAAVLSVALFAVLDYRFDQAPHRLVKMILGAAGIAWIVFRPRVGLFLLPILTPFLPWLPSVRLPGINPLNVLLGTVFVSWALARVMQRQTLFRPSRLAWPIGALVALAALSVVRGAAFPSGYHYDAADSSLQLFRAAVTFATYFIALAMVRGQRDRRLMAWSVSLGLLAEALVTIAYGRNGVGQRAVGSIGQANELGTFLALYAVFAAALIPATRSWAGRLALGGSVAAGAFATILSVSRGGIAALAVGLLYVALKSSRAFTFLVLAALVTAPFWAPDYVKGRFTGSQVEVEGTDEAELDGAAQMRVDTWKAILTLVTDHPIDGVGFAGLAYVLPEAGDALGLEVKDSSHNTFLRCLAEMGIFGLGLFAFLLWRCWKLAHDGRRAAVTPFDRQLSVGLAAATLTLAVSCGFGDRFFNILITGNYWIACALVNDLLLERREADR